MFRIPSNLHMQANSLLQLWNLLLLHWWCKVKL